MSLPRATSAVSSTSEPAVDQSPSQAESGLPEALAVAIAGIGKSEFWASVCEALSRHWTSDPLPEVERIVCLCLGCLDNHASVYQLSLLLLVSEKLGVCHDRCLVFDPCHTDRDRSILRQLGFVVLDSDAEAFTQVPCMTLFYMPHADYNLTDALVWANRQALHRIAVLGNCFHWVCNYSAVNTRAPYVERVLPFIEETELEDTLNRKVQERFASLVPQASRLIGDMLVDCLDCTLTTFPPTKALEGIDWSPPRPLRYGLLRLSRCCLVRFATVFASCFRKDLYSSAAMPQTEG